MPTLATVRLRLTSDEAFNESEIRASLQKMVDTVYPRKDGKRQIDLLVEFIQVTSNSSPDVTHEELMAHSIAAALDNLRKEPEAVRMKVHEAMQAMDRGTRHDIGDQLLRMKELLGI